VQFDTIVTSALVANDASGVIVAIGRTVTAFRLVDGSITPEWSFDLGTVDPPIHRLESLGPNRFAVLEELGYFKVVRWDGTIEYSYNPEALDAADPARTFEEYASYRVFPTPLADKLLLFRNSSDALILNLTTGTLTSKSIEIAAPQGFELMHQIISSRMVFNSGTHLSVRTIGF
jgi:hypothetical protein